MSVFECGLSLGAPNEIIDACQQMLASPKVGGVMIAFRGYSGAPIHIPRAYKAQIPNVVQSIAGMMPGAKVDVSSYRGEKQPIMMTPRLAEHWLEDNADPHVGCTVKARIIRDGKIIAEFASKVWTAVGDFIRANSETVHLVLLEIA